jgi:hypothetical protein
MKKYFKSKNINLWALSFGLPWLLVIFPGISTFHKNIKSWLDLWMIIGEIILPCTILGILTAVIQSLILNENKQFAREWAIVSVIAYSIALPFGLILSTFIPFIFIPELTFDGSMTMFALVPLAMIIGGMLVGLLQLIPLSKLSLHNKVLFSKLFWVFSTMLSWGLSFWLWINLENSGLSLRIVSFISGSFIGLVMGLSYRIITSNNDAITPNKMNEKMLE